MRMRNCIPHCWCANLSFCSICSGLCGKVWMRCASLCDQSTQTGGTFSRRKHKKYQPKGQHHFCCRLFRAWTCKSRNAAEAQWLFNQRSHICANSGWTAKSAASGFVNQTATLMKQLRPFGFHSCAAVLLPQNTRISLEGRDSHWSDSVKY